MVRRLLNSGRLSDSQALSVRQMHQQLASGRRLTREQRMWVEERCREWKLGTRWRARRTDTGSYRAAMVAEFDALPRPRKPPSPT